MGPKGVFGVSVAWIQAIGSIIAILVAIWIGHRNHKHSVRVFEKSRCRDDADRRMKAHSLALAIFPELMELKAKVAGEPGQNEGANGNGRDKV